LLIGLVCAPTIAVAAVVFVATTAAAIHVSVTNSHSFRLCLHHRCLCLQVRRCQQKMVAVGTMVSLSLVVGIGQPLKNKFGIWPNFFLSADQINLYFIQIIITIGQFCGIDKKYFFLLFF
jgi:hypothetical protein